MNKENYLVEMLFLNNNKGFFKVGENSFNHIKVNGKLITDKEEITKLL